MSSHSTSHSMLSESVVLCAQVVAAYLMATEGLSAEAAVRAVQQCRPQVQPNEAFLHQVLALFVGMLLLLDQLKSLVTWHIPATLPHS